MSRLALVRAVILPGLIFQSVIIAGGYATGREMVEFFLSKGPQEGVFGLLLTALIWGFVLAVSFEFARRFQSYNYKSFFQNLLGPWWFLYEIAYLISLLLILSVIGAAAGVLVAESIGIPSIFGTVALVASIGLLTFYGSNLIENVLAGWSIVLYLAYAAFLLVGFAKFGDAIGAGFQLPPGESSWVVGSVQYASYNLAIVPTILFCVRHLNHSRETITAGFLAGILAIVPGILFYCVMVGFYPDILTVEVPMTVILAAMDMPLFNLLFQVVIFGTFIETGTALLHAVNERVAMTYEEGKREMPKFLRPAVAIFFMVMAIFVSEKFGLITLISKGYGYMTYVILALFIVPLLTVGVAKIVGSGGRKMMEYGE